MHIKNERNEKGSIWGLGCPNDAFANDFMGQSYINLLTKKDDYVAISNVTFEPNCRNH